MAARTPPGRMHNGTHYILTGDPRSPKLVVCVPGIGGIHTYYDELEPALIAEGFRVLRYDLIGRGWSGPPAATTGWSMPPACCCLGGWPSDLYSMEAHVMQLYDLLRGLKLVKEEALDASLSSVFSSLSVSGSASTAKAADAASSQTWPQQPQQPSQRWQQEPTPHASTVTAGVGGVPEARTVAAPPSVLSVQQVHVVGHSMGGAISVGFTDRFPGLVASLTLLTPAGLMDKGQFRLLRSLPCCIQKMVQASMRRRVQRAIRNDFLVHGTEVEQRVVDEVQFHLKNNPTAHDAFFRSILVFPLSGLEKTVQRVAATRVPTLLIWALHDRILPFEPHYARWKALLKTGNNVRYEVISDACHGFPLERPERTNQIVLRFVKAPPTFLPTAMLQNLQSHPPTITI